MRILLLVLLVFGIARAERTRSQLLMDALTAADVGVTNVLGRCLFNPPDDAAIDTALLVFDVAIAATEESARSCEGDLFPAAVRAMSVDEQRAYGASYAEQLEAHASALRDLREEFLAQRALTLEHRSIARLTELKYRWRQLTNHAHRTLKR